jgi:hypothetical protein
MVRRHGRRPVDPDAPVVDLDRVLADDLRIDLIGRQPGPETDAPAGARPGGAHRACGRHHCPSADEPLFDLLDDWRQELAGRPLPELTISLPRAPSPPTRAKHRRRSWRPAMAVAAAIGAMLVGSATIAAADADPHSPLWPITQVIWPTRAQSIESTRHAQLALDEARAALDAGRSGDARRAILKAVGELPKIDDSAAQDTMRTTVNELWVMSGPSAASWTALVVAGSSGAPVANEPPGSASEPAAEPDQVAVEIAGSTPDASTGPASAALLGPADPGGPSAGGVTSDPAAAPTAPGVAADVTGSASSTAPGEPAAPATVPDPAVVLESPAAVPTTSSSPPVATQQSAPAPTPTPGDGGSVTPGPLSGTDGGDVQSPATVDQVQATDGAFAG